MSPASPCGFPLVLYKVHFSQQNQTGATINTMCGGFTQKIPNSFSTDQMEGTVGMHLPSILSVGCHYVLQQWELKKNGENVHLVHLSCTIRENSTLSLILLIHKPEVISSDSPSVCSPCHMAYYSGDHPNQQHRLS